MNKFLIMILNLGIISTLSISCQNQKLSSIAPTPTKPLPAWTQKKLPPQSTQQIKILTKIIEIKRPVDSPEIPAKRYEKTLNDAQYQILMRQLAQKKGTSIFTAPSIITHDGANVTLEQTKEFSYPTNAQKTSQYEFEQTGLISHIYANHTRGKNIFLKNYIRISEFAGFSTISPNFKLPIFNRRYSDSSSSLKSGQTLIVGGIMDEIIENSENKTFLNLFKKRTRAKLSREMIITTKAILINSDKSLKK